MTCLSVHIGTETMIEVLLLGLYPSQWGRSRLGQNDISKEQNSCTSQFRGARSADSKTFLELKHEEFEIHSLVFEVSDETEPQWRTATASFRVRLKTLQPTGILLEYWPFDLPSVSVSSCAKSCLLRHAL